MDKSIINSLIEEDKQEFEKISDSIWDFAEIRFKEYRSSELLCSLLEEHGFKVRRNLGGMETCFIGEYGSGSPVIAFLGEFDALPGLGQAADAFEYCPVEEQANGHGCGHNMLGTASLEAACALKKLIANGAFEGTVRYYGCPGEETGAGKAFMVRAGLFEDVDVCLTWHPGDSIGVMNNSLSNLRMLIDFHGKSAHAAVTPHLGRSALDAIELTNVGCNYLREHIIPDARMHYAVLNTGGSAANIVQAYAQELYCIRAPRQDQLKEIYERVCDVARGAALMTGTEVELKVVSAYANIIPNEKLYQIAIEKFREFTPVEYSEEELDYLRHYSTDAAAPVSTEVEDILKFSGSTDVGDVSWVVPTVSLMSATHARGTALHSWEATAQGKSTTAKKGFHLVAKVMTAMAAEILEDKELLNVIKGEYLKALNGKTYSSLIPEDVKPGDI